MGNFVLLYGLYILTCCFEFKYLPYIRRYMSITDKHLSVTISGDVEIARTLERTTVTVGM